MRQFIRGAVATAAVLGIAALLAPRLRERPRPPEPPTARPIRVLPPDSAITGAEVESHRVGAYEIRILEDSASRDRILDIKLHGHRVFAVRDVGVRLEHVGRDVTGDRVPDLVVVAFSGGLHCCTQAMVLSLGDTLGVAGAVNGGDGTIEFDDVDGDGVPEVKVQDWRLAYWRDYAFVETVAPDVVLRWRDGAYLPACDLMREEPPGDIELRRRARTLSDGWTGGDPPPELLSYAVDLIYAGHADLAWRFFDLAWPARLDGKTDFVNDLKQRLQGSPCWSERQGEQVG